MDIARQLPTVLSVCSGYAGIERGLDLAGVHHRVLAYVEIEAFAIANLVQKMENGLLAPAPVYTDLKTFPGHLFRGCVDILTGGYPCQPFSAAGRRLGADDPRHLWPFIDHHIGVIHPRRVFFENVEGHISLGLATVLSDLEERGYDTTWGIFSAAEVGAPHQRKRVYIRGDAIGSECGWRADQPWRQAQADGPTGAGGVPGNLPDARCGCGEGAWCDQCFWPFAAGWRAEPRVGRVVDGCPDRVDRIRLLGNGVVPQTACKAWQVLDAELETHPDPATEKAIQIVFGMNG